MDKNTPEPKAFPAYFPQAKPQDRPLSAAMARMYDMWNAQSDVDNEFYTIFKYASLTGIGKEQGVSRRDPTTVIKEGDTYYVWYTKRQTESEPRGFEGQTDTIPAVDWDLADIWYATSQDGFEWVEQGIAVHRAPQGEYGDRALTTPGLLVYGGKYYLYYQTYTTRWEKGDTNTVSMAWADSPEGPWTRLGYPLIEQGAADAWDSRSIHDPFPMVYRGQIWLYYKGGPFPQGSGTILRAQGVAIANQPEGPFTKSALNPVINSGHETCLYPYREGVAAIASLDGPEKNTIQYAPDGLNFEPKSHIVLPPHAPGAFCPDMFSDTGDGRGITWGLAHIVGEPSQPGYGPGGYQGTINCFIVRFDCSLSRDVEDPRFKVSNLRFGENVFLQKPMRLPEDWKASILQAQLDIDGEPKA